MKTEPENIPSEVFDWMQTTPYHRLSGEQQSMVLQHLSESTYSEWHAVITTLQTQRVSGIRKKALKSQLLQEFDRHYPPASKKVFFAISPGWYRMAAAVLLAVCLGLLARIHFGDQPKSPALALHDTVYMTREIAAAPIRIYDTVYIPLKKQSVNRTLYANPADAQPIPQNTPPIEVVGMADMDELHNRPKNNSMKDDTLLRTYSYVAL